jgi:hypothetical protein
MPWSMGRKPPSYRTTVNVSNETRDRVNALAGKHGRTVDDVIAYLVTFHEEAEKMGVAPKATTRREL